MVIEQLGAGGYRATGYGPSPLRGSALGSETTGTYTITIGAGGVGGGPTRGPLGPTNNPGEDGSDSSIAFSSTLTSTGGGGGGEAGGGGGRDGGSGGGHPYTNPNSAGSGNTPPTDPSQGNPGGHNAAGDSGNKSGSGGGGAIEAGNTDGHQQGGDGAPNTILGPDTTYAGGGGGGGGLCATGAGTAGAGGGGAGGAQGNAGSNATANTGGGGGGGGGTPGPGAPAPNYPGGNGGSGVVVVRGPSAVAFAGSPCCAFTGSTHPGGDKLAKFTASGTLTVSLA